MPLQTRQEATQHVKKSAALVERDTSTPELARVIKALRKQGITMMKQL